MEAAGEEDLETFAELGKAGVNGGKRNDYDCEKETAPPLGKTKLGHNWAFLRRLAPNGYSNTPALTHKAR